MKKILLVFSLFILLVSGCDFLPGGTTPQEKYQVIYFVDADTLGTPIQSVSLNKGDTYVLPLNNYIKPGYEFVSWVINNVEYNPGDKYTMKEEHIVVTIKWNLVEEPVIRLNPEDYDNIFLYIKDVTEITNEQNFIQAFTQNTYSVYDHYSDSYSEETHNAYEWKKYKNGDNSHSFTLETGLEEYENNQLRMSTCRGDIYNIIDTYICDNEVYYNELDYEYEEEYPQFFDFNAIGEFYYDRYNPNKTSFLRKLTSQPLYYMNELYEEYFSKVINQEHGYMMSHDGFEKGEKDTLIFFTIRDSYSSDIRFIINVNENNLITYILIERRFNMDDYVIQKILYSFENPPLATLYN